MLSEKTKELMHIAMGSEFKNAHIMHEISRFTDRDKILKWLIQHGYTGKNLFEWFTVFHNRMSLNMVKYIARYQENEKDKKIIFGKNWS